MFLIKIETKENKYLKDIFAVKLLNDEECREYLASIIAAVLQLDKEEVLETLEIVHPEIGVDKKVKQQRGDVIAKTEKYYANIEINYREYRMGKVKNNIYIAQLLLRQSKRGEKYQKILPIYQINLNNYDIYKKGEFIYHSVMKEDKYQIRREGSLLEIYDISLDVLQKMDYTEVRKLNEKDLKWLLYLFVCGNDKQRSQMYKESGMMKSVEKKLDTLNEEYDDLLYIDYDQYEKSLMQEIYETKPELLADVIEKKVKEANKQAVQDNQKEIIKSLLKDNTPEEVIMKATKITKEELEEIKKSI